MFSRSLTVSSFIFWAILTGLFGIGNSLHCYFCYTKNETTENMEVTIPGFPDVMYDKSPSSCMDFRTGDYKYKIDCPFDTVCFRQTGSMMDNNKAVMTYERRGCVTKASVTDFKVGESCRKINETSDADTGRGRVKIVHTGLQCLCAKGLCNVASDLNSTGAAQKTCSLNMVLMFVPALLCCTETIITFIFHLLPAVFR